ncbi:DUF1330 domain-containing protein [Kibdelosporangium aridum]|uniref:Uncharacterized conserved protein, DUF1330 family n=1 Tax=Kibdelosporangium aridum TaxID=2030 RepID=A0A1W2FB63_KIBAR|nr:DUF1330 domain-containing protein [Kibdelosporangium aridum]SMD19180.1 Uncharacterized conserved protein, DUF1330 family [Kibdelosporangium aridum]
MTAYGLAHLRQAGPLHDDVYEYLERIDATLKPFGAKFLVHGGKIEVQEGVWPGTLVLIEFPSMEVAKQWYESPGYQEILPLRRNHLVGDVILVEGVGEDHDSAKFAAELRAAAGHSR